MVVEVKMVVLGGYCGFGGAHININIKHFAQAQIPSAAGPSLFSYLGQASTQCSHALPHVTSEPSNPDATWRLGGNFAWA